MQVLVQTSMPLCVMFYVQVLMIMLWVLVHLFDICHCLHQAVSGVGDKLVLAMLQQFFRGLIFK